MTYLTRFAVVGVMIASLLFPLSAYAVLIPVGGLVTFVRPCNTGYLITVVNVGIGAGEFMWTPGSFVFPYGPPSMHTWVLGMADVPIPCVIGHILIGYAPRITFSGSSLPLPIGSESAGANSVINAHGLY